MKELDVVLGAYLEHEYPGASSEEQACFRQLLELPDPELYGLLLGRGRPRGAVEAALIERLRGINRRD